MATSGSIKDEEDGHPFPEDLAIDILQRLPVVSLLRFECVSKNWYTLIKSPFFARKHINYNKKDKRHTKILIYEDSVLPITFISFPNDNYNAKPLVEVPYYLHKFRGLWNMIGSVDGLFLLLKGNSHRNEDVRLALWNPATREVTPLPEFQFQDQPPHDYKEMQLGFGIDPVTNDYKVVWFLMYENDEAGRWDPRVYAAVYSSSNDSWRVLEHHKMLNRNHRLLGTYGSAYLNGTYYWIYCAYNKDDKAFVFSFEFSNEVFKEIAGPDIPSSNVFSVMLLDDSLTICATNNETYNEDLWIMIQPGVWNKVFTFRCLSNVIFSPTFCGFCDASTVIYHTKKGWLVSYDIRTEEARHLGYPSWDCNWILYYKESLVTIKRGNGKLDHCSLPDFFDSPSHLSSEFCDLDDLLDTSWLYQ